MGPPGRGRVRGTHRTARGDRDRHGVREVAGLPVAGAGRPAALDRALPGPDQGAGPRPAALGHRARHRRLAGVDAGRRLRPRRAPLRPRLRLVRADQSRHAAPVDPAEPRPVLPAARPADPRRGRRGAPLQGGVRRARLGGAAPAASARGLLRGVAGVRLRVGDDQRAGRRGRQPHRCRRRGGRDRRRIARARPRRGAARADPLPHRDRGPTAGRPHRGRAGDRLHHVARASGAGRDPGPSRERNAGR